MNDVFLKFLSGRTFQIIENYDQAKNRERTYVLFSDVSLFRKYFDLEAGIAMKSCGCLFVNPSKLGVKNLTGREGGFYVIICDTQKIRERVAETGKEIPPGDYIILTEEPSVSSATVVDIPENICTVFQISALNTMIPVSASPFSHLEIDFSQEGEKKEFLSFGNEAKFTLSYLKDDRLTLSANFGALEGLYEIDGMDSLVHSVIGHMKFRTLTVIKDFNSYSVISDYIHKFPKVRNVSHVFAHMANTMYDNGFTREKGIGVIYDSVSYDEGDQVLGSEILYGSLGDFETAGSWKPVPLPGGDIANIEPWRIALALVKEILKGDFNNFDIPLINHIKKNPDYKYIFNAINNKNINYSLSYSMHHIIAALGEILTYEASTYDFDFFEKKIDAFFLERVTSDNYSIKISEEDGKLVIDTYELFSKTISDIFAKVDTEQLIYRSISSIARATMEAVEKVSKKHGEKKVFLGGELFKHPGFLTLIYNQLTEKGFKVYLPKRIPVDDSGVSAGQLIYSYFENDK